MKSRRRAASRDRGRGSPATAMPRWPGPTFESRRGSETSTAPVDALEPADLVDGERRAHRVDAEMGAEDRAQALGGEAMDLDVEVLHRQTQKSVAHGAPDEIGVTAFRADELHEAGETGREMDEGVHGQSLRDLGLLGGTHCHAPTRITHTSV